MSGGISAATVAAYAAAAAAAIGAYASIENGKQAKQTADDNAELARRQADQDNQSAIEQAKKIRKAAAQQQAEANTQLAASGVSLGSGTAVKINDEINLNSEQDAYNTILSGSRSANSSLAQASMYETQGKNAVNSSYLNASASLLQSGANIAKGWKSTADTTGKQDT